MAVFSDMILKKRVLDVDQLFPFSHIWNDRPFFPKKKVRVKGVFFSTNFDF